MVKRLLSIGMEEVRGVKIKCKNCGAIFHMPISIVSGKAELPESCASCNQKIKLEISKIFDLLKRVEKISKYDAVEVSIEIVDM
jgi:hypothetical protein